MEGYMKALMLLAAIVVPLAAVAAAAQQGESPGGLGVLQGSLPGAPEYSLLVFKQERVYQGDLVVYCVQGLCQAAVVVAEPAVGVAVIDGGGGSGEASIPVAGPGIYRVVALVHPAAWLPLLGAAAVVVGHRVGRWAGSHYAPLAAWFTAAAVVSLLAVPALAALPFDSPAAGVREARVTGDYRFLVAEVYAERIVFDGVEECNLTIEGVRVSPGNVIFEHGEARIEVPPEAWEEALWKAGRKIVTVLASCRVELEEPPGVAYARIGATITLPEPRAVKTPEGLLLENPLPVAITYEAHASARRGGGYEFPSFQGSIPPLGSVLIPLDGYERMVVNGVFHTPWGDEPFGAVLP